MKNESLIASGLYGTWTFATQTMTDLGYYKGRAYVIMHLMPDPMQVRSCQRHDCSELSNHLCKRNSKVPSNEECINTETSLSEWSDVTAFFQFGFQLRTGIAFKTYTMMNTSDWLGPYNLVMAPVTKQRNDTDHPELVENTTETLNNTIIHKYLSKFSSRYVMTSASSQLYFPPNATILHPETFDQMVGVTAINTTIHMQQSLHPRQDPFAAYRETCVKGDIPAGILPRIQLGMLTTVTDTTGTANENGRLSDESSSSIQTEISMLRVDFSMLSVPDPKSKLYYLWPSLKKHLGSLFPLEGPYCYGNDPKRAYAIQLAYDSNFDGAENRSWQVIKGCLPDLPCWSDAGPIIPYDNGSSGQYVLDPFGLATLICYLLGLLLIVSLVFNCQLSNQIKRMQERGGEEYRHRPTHQSRHAATPSGRPVPQQQVFQAFHDLEEPLLSGDNTDDVANEEQNMDDGGAEESKAEAVE